jgi:CheY-like chemotaxis protein
VLVIDDDPLVHDLLARYLARDGFRVVAAASGREGLELARTLRPLAITLDVIMPGLDGWAVLAALKSNPDLADIPVVIVTMTDDRHMGYALGAADYVTKPFDPNRLTAILRRHTGVDPAASVLIVDDDPVMREMTRRLLQRDCWEVVEAESGRAALQRLNERAPTLIILDLMMPEMDGFDFILELRKSPAWRSIPVVVLTARDVSEEDRRRLNGSVAKILRKAAYRREELLLEVREQVKACLRLQDAAS